MSVKEWSESTVDYGRKLVHSTVDGVLAGEEEFLEKGRLGPYLANGAKQSFYPAAVGVVVGACVGCFESNRRNAANVVAGGLLGGLIGFGAGMIWETRKLTASIGSSVRRNVQLTRDEHWLQQNPIDYA
jgi:hypothetical protein